MALKMKDSGVPQEESDQGSHTQESGDERFSSDLVHYTTDKYEDILTNPPPKPHTCNPINKTSSVKLIQNEKIKEFELPLLAEKVLFSEDFEPQKVPSEEDSVDLKMPQQPIRSANTMEEEEEEEAVKPSPKTSTFITVEEEITSEDDCLNMKDREPPADESVEPENRRNGNKSKKGRRSWKALMANKRFYLGLGLIVGTVIIAGSIVGAQQKNSGSNNNGSINSGAKKPNSGPDNNGSTSYCQGNWFICKDKGKCLHITAIFRNLEDENPIYQKDKTQAFPKCSEMKAPENNTCSVCFDQEVIRIFCSNITEIVVEEKGGTKIENIQKECPIQPSPGPA